MYTTQRARYEATLARAHRAVWIAVQAAAELGDDGAEQDLTEIMKHLSSMANDSLKGKVKVMKGQLKLDC